MDESSSPVDKILSRGMIGSLLYLTASRPDIMLSVGFCAKFDLNPKESHLKIAKNILRYMKGTQDLVLWFPYSGAFDLVEYAAIDYVGYLVDRKNTYGMTHFLG